MVDFEALYCRDQMDRLGRIPTNQIRVVFRISLNVLYSGSFSCVLFIAFVIAVVFGRYCHSLFIAL